VLSILKVDPAVKMIPSAVSTSCATEQTIGAALGRGAIVSSNHRGSPQVTFGRKTPVPIRLEIGLNHPFGEIRLGGKYEEDD
jgi:hypothetical protein